MVWGKSFKSNLWTSDDQGNARIASLEEDGPGNIYISGEHSPSISGTHAFVIKLSSSGQQLWDKTYEANYPFMLSYGLATNNSNELVFFGHYGMTTYSGTHLWAIRINAATGDTLATKTFTPNHPGNELRRSFTYLPTISKLTNGDIAINGRSFSDFSNELRTDTFYHASVAVFSPQLSFVNGFSVCSKKISDFRNTVITTYPGGKSVYSRTQSAAVNGTYNILYGTVINDKIVKERAYKTLNFGAWTTNFLDMDGKNVVLDQTKQVAIMSDQDSAVSCNGRDTSLSFIQPLAYTAISPDFKTIITNSFVETGRTYVAGTYDLATSQVLCEQAGNCTSIQLTAAANTFCSSTPVTINAVKNKECLNKVYWTYPVEIATATENNDSTLTLKFSGSWKGMIYATLGGCSTIIDSLPVSIQSSSQPVNLGNDTTLCNNTSVTLHAGTSYRSYLWQDRSTDSVLFVSRPGIYNIMVTDSCGNIYRDTIVVKTDISASFDLGPAKYKCSDDSITLSAPAGFYNYQWNPANYITSIAIQNPVVFPGVTTVYKATAKTVNGCSVSASIQVIVKSAPALNLGNDTSFCANDSLVLFAGNNFDEYKWSTGSTSSSTTVNTVGSYSVIAKASNGCYSKDTLVISQVYPTPAINLGNDFNLCAGEVKQLDAGNFNSYKWHDGSTSQYFTAKATGIYRVKVTDNNKCTASDTIQVKAVMTLPSNFLKPLDSLCLYDKLEVKPTNNFVQYVWSNGSTQQSILIDKPGTYALSVTDANGCNGHNTILIVQKNCLNGVYIPTAFTPNNDRRNDIFLARVFGKVVSFKLQVYNRLGQLIFSTSNPAKGWDGSLSGIAASNGTYLYQCSFQLEGGQPILKKGTLVLIR